MTPVQVVEMSAGFKPFTVLLFVLKKFHSFVHVEIVKQYYTTTLHPLPSGGKKTKTKIYTY